MMQADLNQIISNAQMMEVTNDFEGMMQMDMEKEKGSGAASLPQVGSTYLGICRIVRTCTT